MSNETQYDYEGGVEGLDSKISKFTWSAAKTTASILTKFRRIVDYQFAVFPGTNIVAKNGTVDVAFQAHLKVTNATTLGKTWGYSVGTTSGTHVLNMNRTGTVADALVYHIKLLGYR
jgi:hypothetical protein